MVCWLQIKVMFLKYVPCVIAAEVWCYKWSANRLRCAQNNGFALAVNEFHGYTNISFIISPDIYQYPAYSIVSLRLFK